MATLSQHDNLLKQITASRPKRMTIQTYLGTPNRKHALLGLEHLVECSCEDQTDRRFYLCTVCKLTLTHTKIIKHLLSFDHIRCYINAWHPRTLMYSCYEYDRRFHNMMQDFAKQMEGIHGTAITDMKQVILEPALFSSLEGTSYVEALAMLEDWRKERKLSSLITSITPGEQLVHVPGKGPVSVKEGVVATEKEVTAQRSNTETAIHSPVVGRHDLWKPVRRKRTTTPGKKSICVPGKLKTTVKQRVVATEKPGAAQRSHTETAKRPVIFCLLSCQLCLVKSVNILQYFAHVDGWEHKQRMKTIFMTEADELDNKAVLRGHSLMYECQYLNREERSEPVIGLLHIVMCVTARAPYLYVCTVCQCTFPAGQLRAHLRRQRHIKRSLMHQNPARLPFAWKGSECEKLLTSLAWEEEKAQGPEHMVLKIIHLPSWVFMRFSNDYSHVCDVLDEHFSYDWLVEVPKLVTVDDLLASYTSPQLGLQFIVIYQNNRASGSLCLLCERIVNQVELSSHVFSFEHVKAFLHYAHPGSLDFILFTSQVNTNPDVLLNLAKQAEKIHPTGCIQKLTLSSPIHPYTYRNAVNVLKMTKKRMDSQGQFDIPYFPYFPEGEKLVPTEPLREIDRDLGSDILKMTKKPEGDAAKERADVKVPTPLPPDVKDHTPQLGLQFIVIYQNNRASGSLCLLCERIVNQVELSSHIFSFEHVKAFLHYAHPGSLDCEVDKHPDKLLDLAKQAEKIHPTGCIQRVTLSSPIRPYTYRNAVNVLKSTEKMMDSQGQLIPYFPYFPEGEKLVPTEPLREIDRDFGSDILKMTKKPEGDTAKEHPDVKDPTLLHPDVKDPTPLHPGVKDPTPLHPGVKEATPLHPDVKDPTPLPPDVMDPTPLHPDVMDPTPLPPDVKDPTPLHPGVKDPTPLPPDVKDPTPLPPDVKDPTPLPPDVKDTTPQPIPVIKEAVPDKDSCVHEPDEKKCPTQITSVERRADTGTVVDRDTLKQSTEEHKTEEEQKTEKDQPTGQTFTWKFAWLRVSSKSQVTACERVSDAGKVAETETGATSQDTMPTVGRDFVGEMESMTPEKRQWNEQSGSEAGGKRQRLCDTEEGSASEKTCQRICQTVEVLSDMTRDQCVKHKGLSMMTEFQWPTEHSTRNYFRCHCCSRDILRSQHVSHIISAKHRYSYIKKMHPHMVCDWSSGVDPYQHPRELRDLAQQVERDEGWGSLKVTVMSPIRSSKSQALKAATRTPLTADGTSNTMDVSLKPNEDLKMNVISMSVAELTELSNSCLTEATARTVPKGNVVTATSHTDGETTTTSNVLPTNTKLELCSKSTAAISKPSTSMGVVSRATSAISKSTGPMSHLTQTTSSATPIISRTTANSEPTAHVSSLTLAVSESTTTISKPTSTSKPTTTDCHSATLMSKPTATISNTTPEISKLSKSTGTISKPTTSMAVLSKSTSTSDKLATTTSSPTITWPCDNAATPKIKVASKASESVLKMATKQQLMTTSNHVLATNSKLAISSKTTATTSTAPSHAATISNVTSTISNSTGVKSHLTQTTSGATPTVSRTTVNSKPTAHISSATPAMSESTTNVPSTTTSKPSVTVCHSVTVMSKPTANFSNTTPDISKLSKSIATISKPTTSMGVGSKVTSASDKPANPSSSTGAGACDTATIHANEVDSNASESTSETAANQQVTTSNVLATNSELELPSSQTIATTSKHVAPSHVATTSSATSAVSKWIPEAPFVTTKEVNSAPVKPMRASVKGATTSSATSIISKSTGVKSNLTLTTCSATPTISQTTASSKPTPHVSSTTSALSESTTTISKPTSTTTSKPSTTVCHSATVISKPTATFSNTTPHISKLSSSTTTSAFSEAVWQVLWGDFEAAVNASGKAVTTTPAVTGACDTVGSTKNEVTSTLTISKPNMSMGVASKPTGASDKPATTTTSSLTVAQSCGTAVAPQNKVASRTSKSTLKTATKKEVRTTANVLATNAKLAIGSKTTATTSKSVSPSHAPTISSATSAISKSHQTLTTSSATPTISRTTANSKPTAHMSSATPAMSKATTTISKPTSTTTSKASATVHHSATVMPKPTATISNTNLDICKSSKSTTAISKIITSMGVGSKATSASDQPATSPSPTSAISNSTGAKSHLTVTTSIATPTVSRTTASKPTAHISSTTPSKSIATISKCATSMTTSKPTTKICHSTTVMSNPTATFSKTIPAISKLSATISKPTTSLGASFKAMSTSNKRATISSATASISKSTGVKAYQTLTTCSANPTISRTTANSKPTAHISSATPPMSKSTATISKPTTSTSTSKPNTTPAISGSMKSLWKSLEAPFVTEAASKPMSASGKAATTSSPTVTGACDAATPKNEVASKTFKTTDLKLTETSVTATKTHCTLTTCQTTKEDVCMQTYVRSNSDDTTQKLLLSLATAMSPASTCGSSPVDTSICESSPVETSESTRRYKSTTNGPAVGLNFLVCVRYKKRIAIYCQLCEIKTGSKHHRFGSQHRSNYVRFKRPELTADLLDTEILKIATELVKKDTGDRTQMVKMKSEREYEELTKAEVPEALAKIKAILRQQRESQDSPSATNPQPESLKHQDMSTGLHEPSHHPDGNKPNQSPDPLATGSQSSPVDTLPTDTRPESPQSCDVQIESSEDTRTQPVTLEDSRTQKMALHDTRTQTMTPEDTRTQPVTLQDSIKQQGGPHCPREHQEAPPDPGRRQQAPLDSDTPAMAPQCSGTSQKAPQRPGIQPQNPEPREIIRIKLEETQKPLERPDRRMLLDPDSGLQQPVLHPVHRSISAGALITSRVSCYLKVKLSEAERNRVVGLSSVLECQCGDISERLFPFYMCRSCQETVQLKHICGHIISADHQHKYMWKEFPHLMTGIKNMENLSEKQRTEGYEMVISEVAEREHFLQMDAEVILLDKNSYHRVHVAPFNEGINILEDMWRQQTSSCLPADQRPPEVTDKKSLIETTPINLAIVKTEPIPEPLTTLNTHSSNITVTIKQEVKQEDHTHSCFFGHTEMRKTVKHGLESSNGETDKRRRISMSPDGRGTHDSPSGLYSVISSPASNCPSPQDQEIRVKVEPSHCPSPQNQEVRVKVEPSHCPSPQHQEVRVKVEPSHSPSPQHQEVRVKVEPSHCPSPQHQEVRVKVEPSHCPSPQHQEVRVKVEPSHCPSPQHQEVRVKVEPNQCPSPQNEEVKVKVETSRCPSPQNQEVRMRVETTSVPTTLVSQAPPCEPSQMQPQPKLQLVLNSLQTLASSNFHLECPPTKPASDASAEPSASPWIIDFSLAKRVLQSIPSTLPGAKQASPLLKLTSATAVPLSPAADEDLPSTDLEDELITSLVDKKKLRRTSSVRAKQLQKDVSPRQEKRKKKKKKITEIVAMTSTSTQISVGRVKPRIQLDSKCRIPITKPTQNFNVLKCEPATTMPADDDTMNYENRQFMPEIVATKVVDDDGSPESRYLTVIQTNTAQVLQASNAAVSPLQPASQQFNDCDYRINLPTVATVSPFHSLPAAGYGISVYPYFTHGYPPGTGTQNNYMTQGQGYLPSTGTQNSYFAHGYPQGTETQNNNMTHAYPSGTGTQNYYFMHGYPPSTGTQNNGYPSGTGSQNNSFTHGYWTHGSAGIHRAPEQHSVFSQYVNYSVPPPQMSGGACNTTNPPAGGAWPDMQRQQHPQ